MKSNCRFIHCCLLLVLAFHIPLASAEPIWQNPVIRGHKVHPMPEAAVQPSRDREYKILFDVTKAAGTRDQVNPGLEHVARLINLFALAKVPPEKLKIVAVPYDPATAGVLDDRHYREKYQFDNPDRKLINALKRAGVIVYVCGQALAHRGLEPVWVNLEVDIALAR